MKKVIPAIAVLILSMSACTKKSTEIVENPDGTQTAKTTYDTVAIDSFAAGATINNVKTKLDTVGEKLDRATDKTGEKLDLAAQEAKDKLDLANEKLKEKGKDLKENAKKLGEDAKKAAAKGAEAVENAAQDVKEDLKK